MIASIEFLFDKFASEATNRNWTTAAPDVPIVINEEPYWIDLITLNEKDNLLRTYTDISFPHFGKGEESAYIKREFERINYSSSRIYYSAAVGQIGAKYATDDYAG